MSWQSEPQRAPCPSSFSARTKSTLENGFRPPAYEIRLAIYDNLILEAEFIRREGQERS